MKRFLRLLVFGIVGLAIVLGGGALLLFRNAPVAVESNPATVPDSPTIVQSPTVTAEQRAQLQTIAIRAMSMAKAAQDLQRLGEAIRIDAMWRGKVKASTSVILGGAKTIDGIELPSFLSPLAKRITDTTAACVVPAAFLDSDVTTITIKDVADQEAILKTCARDFERIALQIGSVE
jgi:hypothetical protein